MQSPARLRRSAAAAVDDPDCRLLCELYGSLRGFAAVVAPDNVEPDDLVQEALTRALRIRPLRELDNPGAYLRRTMLNLAANARRTAARQQHAFTLLVRNSEPAVTTYPSDVAMLFALPPDVRAVLYLAEVEGCSYAEIGELLGCTAEAARTRASRGRHMLRSLMEADDG